MCALNPFLLFLLMHSLHCERYVVNTDNCKIIDPDPFAPDVMREFSRMDYNPCSTVPPLTYVAYNDTLGVYELKISRTGLESFLNRSLVSPKYQQLGCCLKYVQRYDDDDFALGPCRKFYGSVLLPNDRDAFIVQCRAKGKLVYTTAHATVPERKKIRQRLDYWKAQDLKRCGVQERPPSVLLIGIDTVSRLNLMRAMPKTYEYLQTNGWFEMAGYNKIDDNTFPNFMAFLTGYNRKTVDKKCNMHKFGGLDNCKYMWNLYHDAGYVTAYGEDDVDINTFNYDGDGFRKQPVDYYMRPYMMAAEAKLLRRRPQNNSCLGYVHDSEHIYDYSLEFARRYRNDSFFGLFWTNTHSHGLDFSLTSSMDTYLVDYLERFVRQGTMEHTVVVLLSDHGQRYGPSRATSLGWLEDRLPFFFIWLPPYLRKSYPDFVQALQVNRNRLTTPYDLHLTLKHLLILSNRRKLVKQMGVARDCPHCQSLLLPVEKNRSCADVAIPNLWCTCWQHQEVNGTNELVKQLGQYAIKRIKTTKARGCGRQNLRSISKVMLGKPNISANPELVTHILHITTDPNRALYEVTILYNDSSKAMAIINMQQLEGPFCGQSMFMKHIKWVS